MARVFSTQDGNLASKPIITSRKSTYRDIDLTFAKKPNGDIYKKTDAEAVKQAVKNLLLTNFNEKPFQPYYGGDLNRFLFSLSEEFDEIEIQDRINSAIANHERRAIVRNVKADITPDQNAVNITVTFQVVNTLEIIDLTVQLTRLR
jgi:phage baseplate assembly protein W